MGLFDKILGKLGLKKPEEETATPAKDKVESKPPASQSPASQRPATSQPASQKPPVPTSKPAQPGRPVQSRPPLHAAGQHGQAAVAPAKPAPMAMVDVMSKLETMAKGTNLDWKVSIVDLLKVLDIDSSLQARKELATELGVPPDIMKDNVRMNVWLHKTVLAKIAENGGNVPKEMLD